MCFIEIKVFALFTTKRLAGQPKRLYVYTRHSMEVESKGAVLGRTQTGKV